MIWFLEGDIGITKWIEGLSSTLNAKGESCIQRNWEISDPSAFGGNAIPTSEGKYVYQYGYADKILEVLNQKNCDWGYMEVKRLVSLEQVQSHGLTLVYVPWHCVCASPANESPGYWKYLEGDWTNLVVGSWPLKPCFSVCSSTQRRSSWSSYVQMNLTPFVGIL